MCLGKTKWYMEKNVCFGGIVMIVVAHNLAAMNAQRQFNITDKKKAKNVEKLSSGYKINRSADDAAGLSISEKMRNQIRGLHQAMNNIEDGVHFCKTGEGALNECHNILNRLEELAVKAANDVNEKEDRESIDAEVKQLQEEIRKTFRNTEFNGKKYFSEPYMPEMVGEPDDFQVYNGDDNSYGGLLIDGVRYSWSELTALPEYTDPDRVDQDGNPLKYYSFSKGNPEEKIELNNAAQMSNFIASDGTYKDDFTIRIWTPADENGVPSANLNSECLEFKLNKGDKIPSISRKYSWEAKDDGIYMNNRLGSPTISWEDLSPAIDSSSTDNIPAGEYSFNYHNTVIYFEVPKNATFDDVKAGINKYMRYPTNANTDDIDEANLSNTIDWRGAYDCEEEVKAVDIIDYSSKVYLTNSNKFLVDQNKNPVIEVTDYNSDLKQADKADYSNIDYDKSGVSIAYGSLDNLRPEDRTGDVISTLVYNPGEDEYEVHRYNINDVIGYSNKPWIYTTNINEVGDWNTIVDFDRGNAENPYIEQTFDTSATYNYEDSFLGFSFDYKLASTTSYGAVEKGLETEILTAINAPLEMTIDVNGAKNTYISNTQVEMSYNLQRNSHKDFDDMDASFPMGLKAPVKDGDDYIFEYKVTNEGDGINTPKVLASDKYTLTKDKLYNACKTGEAITFEFGSDENEYGESFNVKFDVSFDPFENDTDQYKALKAYAQSKYDIAYNETFNRELQNDRDYYSTHQESITNDDGSVSYISFDDSEYKKATEQRRARIADTEARPAYADAYDNKYNDYLEAYMSDCIDGSTGLGQVIMEVKAAEQPYMTCYVNENEEGNVATKASTNVLMNPVDRGLYIQSGANAGEDTYLEWDSLNLNVIGLGNANVTTRENATRFIEHVQYASKIISANRSRIGAQQNRLERTFDANAGYSENLQNAESSIRDTDMAKEAMDLAKHGILQQAGQSMMAQANQQNQGILQLIQS